MSVQGLCLFPSLWSDGFSLSVCAQKLKCWRSQWHQKPGGDQIPPRNRGRHPSCRYRSPRSAHRWPDYSHCCWHRPGRQRRALQCLIPRNRCVFHFLKSTHFLLNLIQQYNIQPTFKDTSFRILIRLTFQWERSCCWGIFWLLILYIISRIYMRYGMRLFLLWNIIDYETNPRSTQTCSRNQHNASLLHL